MHNYCTQGHLLFLWYRSGRRRPAQGVRQFQIPIIRHHGFTVLIGNLVDESQTFKGWCICQHVPSKVSKWPQIHHTQLSVRRYITSFFNLNMFHLFQKISGRIRIHYVAILLFMKEILLHQLRLVVYPIIYRCL